VYRDPRYFNIDNADNRNVYAMSNGSHVDVILSDVVQEIGDASVVDEEHDIGAGGWDLFTMQCGLSDSVTTSEF
jgi:hypothetical protein